MTVMTTAMTTFWNLIDITDDDDHLSTVLVHYDNIMVGLVKP